MKNWCEYNSSSLSENKTFVFQFTITQNIDFSVFIESTKSSLPQWTPSNFWELLSISTSHFNLASLFQSATICFAKRTIRSSIDLSVLRTFIPHLFQSLLSYGLIFCGSSPFMIRAFVVQKRILKCLLGVASNNFCKPLFVQNKIFYIFKLIMYVRNNFS